MSSPDVGLGRDVDELSLISDYHKFFATLDENAVLIKSGRYDKKLLVIDIILSLRFVQSFGVIRTSS